MPGFPSFFYPVAPPPSGSLVATDLGAICAAAQAAIVAGFRLPGGSPIAARAVNLAVERRPYPDMVPQVLVVPEGQRPDAGVVAGAGRHAPLREGRLTVVFISRYARDKVGTANRIVSDPTHGLYGWALASLDNILTTEFLFDGSGDQLTAEPLELASGGNPRPYYGDGGSEYYGCEWTWGVKWLQSLTVGAGD